MKATITLQSLKVAIDCNKNGRWTCSLCGNTFKYATICASHVVLHHTGIENMIDYFRQQDFEIMDMPRRKLIKGTEAK